MELFYAASDLVLARAGGGVAELTVTATPSILIPGVFGSSGHQAANAAFLSKGQGRGGLSPRIVSRNCQPSFRRSCCRRRSSSR